MTDAHHITDEDLTAYLDNQADPDLSARIEAALRTDAGLAARLSDLSIPTDDIRAALDSTLTSAPAMPDLPAAPRMPRTGGVIAASLAAGVLLGALVAGQINRKPTQGWHEFVAAYQALYVPQTLAAAAPTDAQNQIHLGALSETLGLDITSAPGDPVLTFKRAQQLGFDGRPLIQIAYLSPDGDPVALCITRVDGPDRDRIATDTMLGMQAASWQSDGYGFLLIGGSDPDVIRDAAERFRARL